MPIFVSYRHGRTDHVAGRIFDRLQQRFPEEEIFFDVDRIPLGVDFHQFLSDWVDRSDIFLAVIGDDWTKERLEAQNDFVRIEIEAALSKSIPVIPVLVNGIDQVPSPEELPPALESLSRRQGIRIGSGQDFQGHIEQLLKGIEHHLPGSHARERPSCADSPSAATESLAKDRVRIEYSIETEEAGVESKVELPFIIGMLADLSGANTCDLPDLVQRNFMEIRSDTFDDHMAAIKPRVRLRIRNTLTEDSDELPVELEFKYIEDFSPEAFSRQIPLLAPLIDARGYISNLVTYLDGKQKAQIAIETFLENEEECQKVVAQSNDAPFDEVDGYGVPSSSAIVVLPEELENVLSTQPADRQHNIREGIVALARSIREDGRGYYGSRRLSDLVQENLERLDSKLSRQINEILHAPEFQSLESTWRGLEFLLKRISGERHLRVKVLNLAKPELADAVASRFTSTYEKTILFDRLYNDTYDVLGGQPFGCLICSFLFSHSSSDLYLLTSISSICQAIHAPFIAGLSPHALQMRNWEELSSRYRISKVFELPEYAHWRSLRDAWDARYLVLAMPGFLTRHPYTPDSFERLTFEEDVDGYAHDKYCWASGAFLLGMVIGRAFARHGWVARIRGLKSGGAIDGLPLHHYRTRDGGEAIKSPTEVSLTGRQQNELEKNGILPISNLRDTGTAAIMSVPTLHRAHTDVTKEGGEYADLYASLPHVFAASRFGQYVKCIVRDNLANFLSREDMQRYLNRWLANYVSPRSDNSGEAPPAHRPLAAGSISIEEVDDELGGYRAVLVLEPRYQFDHTQGLMRLETWLPPVRGG